MPEAELATDAPRLGYLPWMDGMRAIAVLAVCLFHETIYQPQLGIGRWIGAGYLGVDVFFAVSGFLITALLLREAADLGAIRFGAFYIRRARRLVPALATVLVVLVLGALFLQNHATRTATLRHVVVAATYTTNWFTVIRHHNIGELNHTWSLAAEEQFYLLWPALLTLLLVVGRRSRAVLIGGIASIAALTLAWPVLATVRHWSYQRIYYGLDTRAAALGVGALLGALYMTGALPRGRAAVWVRRLAGLVGAITLVLVIHSLDNVTRVFGKLGLNGAYAINWAFGIIGVATTLLVWELLDSSPHLGHRVLSWPPLVFVGRISYGVYLWDALVVIYINPHDHRGWPLVAAHLVLTFAAATVSWFVIETRFRRRRPGPAPSGSEVPGG